MELSDLQCIHTFASVQIAATLVRNLHTSTTKPCLYHRGCCCVVHVMLTCTHMCACVPLQATLRLW
jgi:hypothetical protein